MEIYLRLAQRYFLTSSTTSDRLESLWKEREKWQWSATSQLWLHDQEAVACFGDRVLLLEGRIDPT